MPHPKQPTPAELRAAVVKEARSLVGIREVHTARHPTNGGPDVLRIQSATGAYYEPWCVSTVQYIWKQVLGTTWADDTAGAYFLADFAVKSRRTIPHPIPGCAVVYHIGAGHAGTVEAVKSPYEFTAIEGNEADAVNRVARDARHIACTFVLRPELHDK